MTLRKTWCKVYIADANEMTEVADETAQFIVSTPPEFSLDSYPENTPEIFREMLKTEGLGPTFRTFPIFNLLGGVISECYRVLKPDGVFIWNVGFSKKPYSVAFDEQQINCLLPYLWVEYILHSAPFKIHEDFIWVKGVPSTQKTEIRHFTDIGIADTYEHFFMFKKSNKFKCHLPKEFGDTLFTTWFAPFVNKTPILGGFTPFSEQLITFLLKLFTDEGDVVLDPLSGMGTVGQVAMKLKRNCILYEKNMKLKPIIKANLEEVMGEEARITFKDR